MLCDRASRAMQECRRSPLCGCAADGPNDLFLSAGRAQGSLGVCAVREELNQHAVFPLQTYLHIPSEQGKNGMEVAWLVCREALALLKEKPSAFSCELPWVGGASLWLGQGMMGC